MGPGFFRELFPRVSQPEGLVLVMAELFDDIIGHYLRVMIVVLRVGIFLAQARPS